MLSGLPRVDCWKKQPCFELASALPCIKRGLRIGDNGSAESHAAKNDAWGRNLAEALPPEIPVLRPVLSGGFQNAAIGNRNCGVNQTADVY